MPLISIEIFFFLFSYNTFHLHCINYFRGLSKTHKKKCRNLIPRILLLNSARTRSSVVKVMGVNFSLVIVKVTLLVSF